jgi:hypothetical protein
VSVLIAVLASAVINAQAGSLETARPERNKNRKVVP